MMKAEHALNGKAGPGASREAMFSACGCEELSEIPPGPPLIKGGILNLKLPAGEPPLPKGAARRAGDFHS